MAEKPADMTGIECRDLHFKGRGVFSIVRTGLAVATIISSSGRAELPHHANISKQDFPQNAFQYFSVFDAALILVHLYWPRNSILHGKV